MPTESGELELGPLKDDTRSDTRNEKFVGDHRQEFSLWAHNMALIAALAMIVLGVFGVLWARSPSYGCEVDGRAIAPELIRFGTSVKGALGRCVSPSSGNTDARAVRRRACCNPQGRSSKSANVGGSSFVGLYCVVAGVALLVFEHCCGLWMRGRGSFWYESRVSPHGVLFTAAGLPALGTYATCTAGVFTLSAGAAYSYAALRREAGDGGRERRVQQRKKASCLNDDKTMREYLNSLFLPDSSATTFWLIAYFGANIAIFANTLAVWVVAVQKVMEDLKKDKLNLDRCNECPLLADRQYTRWRDECHLNKILIKNGSLTSWAAPLAKAAGVSLNLNCALLILPVTKNVIIFVNRAASGSYRNAQRRSACFLRLFGSPSLARYLPFLNRNIEIHKLIAKTMAAEALVHVVCHFINYWQAPYFTRARFARLGWFGTPFLTGALILFAMFALFAAATDTLKRANFEIYFFAHHFFILFYAAMLLHGPTFYYWSLVPIALYACERYSRNARGAKPMVVSRVEWIAPVLAIHFCPLEDKGNFSHKLHEGMYVFLNCPHISQHEWHPFTISSARGDLITGSRVSLGSCEDVAPVTVSTKTGKHRTFYRHVSRTKKRRKKSKVPSSSENGDYEDMEEDELLDAGETVYHDYVSVHIKVQEPEDSNKTWTQKLKDYLDLMAPQEGIHSFHLTRRDERGDVHLGRYLGPDARPILRVDGPHAAPAMHYKHYGTVMICGAGIGMTPCASILTAMLKYRWRKNFKPEILHFYWVVAYGDVEAFKWFIMLIADLEHDLLKSRASGLVANRNYAEIHIFVTRAPIAVSRMALPISVVAKNNNEVLQTSAQILPPPPPPRIDNLIGAGWKSEDVRLKVPVEETHGPPRVFSAEHLFAEMQDPQTSSTRMGAVMVDAMNASNRFQDTWVWNGRPDWYHIFSKVKGQRQHRDIGVCFCGTPVIGNDLAAMCRHHSSASDDCIFTLHKEDF